MMRELSTTLLAAALLLPAAAAQQGGDPEFPRDWFWHQDDSQWEKHAAMLGKKLPKLDLSDWINGKVDLREGLAGKVVVVDFWATWCGPCIRSIPHNNELYAKHEDEGLVFIGVCGSQRGQDEMAAVVESKGIAYPVARDASLKSAEAWNVMWWPTYAVADREGKLRAIGLQPEYVDEVVEKLLAEGPPERRPVEAAEAVSIPADWLETNPNRDTRLKKITGKPAPALRLTGWKNSEPLDLAGLRGKVVMLDFWATWCGPCIKSIPHTNELMAKYGRRGLVVIGVCHPKGGDRMAETAKENGIEYPVALDAAGKTIAAYGVNSFPDYYFIDRAGNLVIADCVNEKVDAAIELLLGVEK